MNIDEKDLEKNHLQETASEETTTENYTEDTEQENNQEPEQDEEILEDYSHHSKEELYEALVAVKSSNMEIGKAFQTAQQIKPFFDDIIAQEKEEALEKFVANGGEADGFEYKLDEKSENFYTLYSELRKDKNLQKKQIEQTLQSNLEKRQQLIEKLRELTHDNETENSFKSIKEVQKEWKAIGQVPKGTLKNLWASYNALMDIFYNNQSIYFDLKDLDRKRNLEAKLELCEKAESLLNSENIKQAVKDLNDLHEEFKHIGPTPKEDQEAVWERFKKASDAIYDKKRAMSEVFKKEMEENLVKKQALCDKVKAFESFDSDRIKNWNEETQKLLEVQKEWEAIGMLPKEKAKEVTKNFWSSFKTFFKNKSDFFKKLDESREENLIKKQELLEKAKTLVESHDKSNTEEIANSLKDIQEAWRNIGPVPEKKKEEVVVGFRKLLDQFFDQRRQKFADRDKEFKENLTKKQELCEQIEQLAETDLSDFSHEATLNTFVNAWKGIGFVPKKNKDKITERFQEALSKLIQHIPNISDEQKEMIQIETELALVGGGRNKGSKSLGKKEEGIRRRIKQLDEELVVLKNNLGFFANSKQANKIKEDFENKAKKLNQEITTLKKQLKMLRKLKDQS